MEDFHGFVMHFGKIGFGLCGSRFWILGLITDFGELGFGFRGLRIQTFGVSVTDFGELGILGFNYLL